MFGMSFWEILIILGIALIVIGPEKLPKVAKTLGRTLGEFKKATGDFKQSFDLGNDSAFDNISKAFQSDDPKPEATASAAGDAAPADPADIPLPQTAPEVAQADATGPEDDLLDGSPENDKADPPLTPKEPTDA